jgi:hypothetical protein
MDRREDRYRSHAALNLVVRRACAPRYTP